MEREVWFGADLADCKDGERGLVWGADLADCKDRERFFVYVMLSFLIDLPHCDIDMLSCTQRLEMPVNIMATFNVLFRYSLSDCLPLDTDPILQVRDVVI